MKNIISKIVIVAIAMMIIACPSPEDTITSSSIKVESEKDKQERIERDTAKKEIKFHINEFNKLHVKLKNANFENREQILTKILYHISEIKKVYVKLGLQVSNFKYLIEVEKHFKLKIEEHKQAKEIKVHLSEIKELDDILIDANGKNAELIRTRILDHINEVKKLYVKLGWPTSDPQFKSLLEYEKGIKSRD